MHKTLRMTLMLLLIFAVALAGCATERGSALPPASPLPDPLPQITIQPMTNPDFSADAARPYLAQVSFTPAETTYFELVNQVLPLTQDEIALLGSQGFVLSERWSWQCFVEAYAWI